MFSHDWDNPIEVNNYSSTQDLKGIVKPISVEPYSSKFGIYSFTVTEDVMAMVIEHYHSYTGTGSNLNTSDSESPPYFKKLHKGTIYYTNLSNGTGYYDTSSRRYTIYPNVK